MAETTEKTGEKKLGIGSSKTLSLKARGVEQSVVRQNFSHGRTKQVLVEKVKTRAPGKPKAEPTVATPAAPPPQGKRSSASAPTAKGPAAAPAKPSGLVLKTLTAEEQQARVHALADARLKDAEERRIAEEQAHIREMREAIERTEREAAESRKREEDDRRRHEEEAKRKAEQEAKKRFGGGEEEAKPKISVGALARTQITEPEEEEAPRSRRPGGAARPAAPTKAPRPAGGEKRRPRLTLVTALQADEVREHSKASFVRRTKRRMKDQAANEPKEKRAREVTIPEFI